MSTVISSTLKRIKLKNTSATLQKIKVKNILIDDRYYDKDNYPNIDWDMISEYFTSISRNNVMDMSKKYTTLDEIQSDYQYYNNTGEDEDTAALLALFLKEYAFSYSLQKIKIKEKFLIQ